MRRTSIALLLALALVAATCSSDDSNDTTTEAPAETTATTAEETTSTEEETTMTTPPFGVPVLSGRSTFWTPEPADPFGFSLNHIQPIVIPGVAADGALLSPLTDAPEPGIDPSACLFVPGQVLTTESDAPGPWVELSSFYAEQGLELQSVLDPVTQNPIGIAEVDPGTEAAFVLELLGSERFADLNRIMVPGPKWQYGPASMARPVDPRYLPEAIGGEDTVWVIDIFGVPGGEPTITDVSAVGQHGEFISGIIARMGANPMPVHVNLYGPAGLSESAAIAGAIQGGVNNLSMGTGPCTFGGTELPPLIVAIAIQNHDATVVAAAGNLDPVDLSTPPDCAFQWYPAAFAEGKTFEPFVEFLVGGDIADHVVSVAAGTWDEGEHNRASFSMCGPNSVWMPGSNIVSDYNNGAAVWDGSSFAAPQVAAQLALNTP